MEQQESAAAITVKRSRSRVKDLQGLFSRGGNRSALRTKSPFRPTISAPIMNEGASGEPKRKEESSEEEDARKEAYTKAQSMKSLFQQGQTITTKRMPSRDRKKSAKSEPVTPTGTLKTSIRPSDDIHRPSHKLPALVRDHALTLANRNKSTEVVNQSSSATSRGQDQGRGQREFSHSISSDSSARRQSSVGQNLGASSQECSSVGSNRSSNSSGRGRAAASYSISPSNSPPAPSRKSSIGFALEEEQDNLSVVRTEDRRTLPAPPPPPKPVRLDSSLRAPPGLVKLRQKIQLHTTKLKPSDYVGFSKLPYQVYRRAVKRGFCFNLMLAGESGLGKASLINSMFLADVCQKKRTSFGSGVQSQRVRMEEGEVKLNLNVLDLPGFGDEIDNSRCWHPLVDYIEEQFQQFLHAETRINRLGQTTEDNRVHALLYFISPTGHGLRPLDIEVMLGLHTKVNIIPVIAKADTFTAVERKQFKEKVREQLRFHGIEVFKFLGSDARDEEDIEPPFAVVGSNVTIEREEGKNVRGREYPWGVVDIENKDHCDFTTVQNLLWGQNTQDLIESTHQVHYENFRCRKLLGDDDFKKAQCGAKDISRVSLLVREEEKVEHERKLVRVEAEMSEVFNRKVEQKVERLRQTEASLEKRIEREQAEVKAAWEDLEGRREEFLKEKKIWEKAKSASVGDLLREGKGEGEDKDYPDVPKNWGFMTLRRTKKK